MRNICIVLLILFSFESVSPACSTAVISGRATLDGRPLLWKHRDTKDFENHVTYFEGEKYNFIGVVETKDANQEQVWMGSNSVGFSIMNNVAYNLDEGETYKGPMHQEGLFMKRALSQCATLSDFEVMLDQTQGQRGVKTSFGVIDAQGGAAFYEASPDTYEKFDATDPKQAPAGYLIRTNFAFSGENAKGSGYIRYQTLEDLFFWAGLHDEFTPEFLLLEASRCLENSLLKTDLTKTDLPENAKQTRYIPFQDYIVRPTSVSTLVIQGVKPDENPELTTLYVTIPGFQLTSLTIPLWVKAGRSLCLI